MPCLTGTTPPSFILLAVKKSREVKIEVQGTVGSDRMIQPLLAGYHMFTLIPDTTTTNYITQEQCPHCWPAWDADRGYIDYAMKENERERERERHQQEEL